jgi:hypothetical protein
MAKRNVFYDYKLALAGASMCGDLLKEAEAKLEAITNARLEWAMVCQCTCAACDKFYDAVRDVMDADLKGITAIDTRLCGTDDEAEAMRSAQRLSNGRYRDAS